MAADNTELDLKVGGDVIRTDLVGTDEAGRSIKIQGVKFVRGGKGVDDGFVVEGFPMTVEDRTTNALLEEIRDLLKEIRDQGL